MKLINLIFLFISLLFTQVVANNDAVAYELIYFYYVYKFEWELWGSNGDRTIAVECGGGAKLCCFGKFAWYLMSDEWKATAGRFDKTSNFYKTTSPDGGDATTLSKNLPHSARYQLDKLKATFTKTVSMPEVFQEVLHSANTVLSHYDEENINKVDLKMMLKMAREVLDVRYESVAGHETYALSMVAGYDQFEDYLVFEERFINWDKTLESIDEAVGFDLTQKLATEYKASIINFAQNIESRLEAAKSAGFDIMHLNIARAISTTITQLKEFEDSDSDPFSRSTCSSDDNVEFGYSDSD